MTQFYDVAAHRPEGRLEGETFDFHRKARVSRRAGVIDGRLLTIRLRSEEDECRFIYTTKPGTVYEAYISQINPNLTNYLPEFLSGKSRFVDVKVCEFG